MLNGEVLWFYTVKRCDMAPENMIAPITKTMLTSDVNLNNFLPALKQF